MKKIILLLFGLGFLQISFAQKGFNQIYNLSESGLNFDNILLRNDTLFLYGGIQDANTGIWNILFAQVDTLGNLLDYKIYEDTLGDNLLAEASYGFISTSDGGFAMVGGVFERETGFFIKVDKEGEFAWFQEYIDNDIRSFFQRLIIEVEDGFLIAGYKQKQNFYLDIFLTKTDKAGNKLWEKSYGELESNEIVLSLQGIDDNTFVLGGSEYTAVQLPIDEKWSRSWIFAVDSLGELKWEWKSEKNEELHCNALNISPNGDWLYTSLEREATTFNDFVFYPKIVRRDKDFILLWENRLEVRPTSINVFTGLLPTPDGNYLAYGNWVPPVNSPYEPDGYSGFHKIHPSGYDLWTSIHRRTWETIDTVSEEYLSGAVILPSGSIIAAGRSDRRTPNPAQSYGWLVKIDANGCVDTLCNILVAIEEAETAIGTVKVFPNPAQEQVTLEWSGVLDAQELRIIDLSGRVIYQTLLLGQEERIDWFVGELANGIYFYQILSNDNRIRQGKIVVQH